VEQKQRYLSQLWPVCLLKDILLTPAEITLIQAGHQDNEPSLLEKTQQPLLERVARELGARVEVSYLVQDMLHIADYAIVRGDGPDRQCCYIEINGPPHFNHAGKPDRRYYLRKKMYTKAGAHFISLQIKDDHSQMSLKCSNCLPQFAKDIWRTLKRSPVAQAVSVLHGGRQKRRGGRGGSADPMRRRV
jgi:hypothetical protein